MLRLARITTWSRSFPVSVQRTVIVRLYALGSQEWFSRCAMLPAAGETASDPSFCPAREYASVLSLLRMSAEAREISAQPLLFNDA